MRMVHALPTRERAHDRLSYDPVSEYLGVMYLASLVSQRFFAVLEASSVLDRTLRRLKSIGVGSN